MSYKKITIWQIIVSVSLIINLLSFQNNLFGTIIFILWFGLNIILLQNWLQQKFIIKSYLIASLLLIALFCFGGALIYFLYQLNDLIIIALVITVSASLTLLNQNRTLTLPKIKLQLLALTKILALIYCLLVAALFYLLFSNQTEQAIQSPWHMLPNYFFILYIIATFLLLGIYKFNQDKNFSLLLTCLHFFLSFSIALIIYKLGYGYDPFIHQTTEQLIFDQGYILPKPFYYLGQYSLVVILSKLTYLKIDFWDKIILPLMAAAYLPTIIFLTCKNWLATKKQTVLIASLSFLILPFSFLINTTPQGLSNLFTLIIIFLSLLYFQNKFRLSILCFLALVSLAIHPLAGIPALIYVVLISFAKLRTVTKKIFILIVSLLSTIIIPLTFIINAKLSGQKLGFQIGRPLLDADIFHFHQLHYCIRDLIYFIADNYTFLIIIAALFGLVIYWRKNKQRFIWFLPLTSLILFVNYFIVKKFLVFEELISYERDDYSWRLIQISLFFLSPLILYLIAQLTIKIKTIKIFSVKLFFCLLFVLLITTSVYISYPRFDDYESNKGYNVSAADFEAVRLIDQDSQNAKYIVLAPQTTSAAAVKLFGFANYYNEIFYYPIPTGGQLYQYYLKMVYNQPNSQIVKQALDLTNADVLYFVVPNFWKNSSVIIDQTRPLAQTELSDANEEITIFKFSN